MLKSKTLLAFTSAYSILLLMNDIPRLAKTRSIGMLAMNMRIHIIMNVYTKVHKRPSESKKNELSIEFVLCKLRRIVQIVILSAA